MSRVNRTAQIQGWMDRFRQSYPSVEYFDEIEGISAAALIDSCYWEWLEDRIKPRMADQSGNGHVDRHKMASLYEVIIAAVSPIVPSNGDVTGPTDPLNYTFAYFVAQVIMDTFGKENGMVLDYFISDEFDREHIALLSISTPSEGFVFANAATWYLVEKYCLDRETNSPETKNAA
jgi:hypothetical protein